jgi:hypothetical protein
MESRWQGMNLTSHARLHGVRVVRWICNCSKFITIHWKYRDLVVVSRDRISTTLHTMVKQSSSQGMWGWNSNGSSRYNSSKDQTGDSTLTMRKKSRGKTCWNIKLLSQKLFFLSKKEVNPRKMQTQWHWNLAFFLRCNLYLHPQEHSFQKFEEPSGKMAYKWN